MKPTLVAPSRYVVHLIDGRDIEAESREEARRITFSEEWAVGYGRISPSEEPHSIEARTGEASLDSQVSALEFLLSLDPQEEERKVVEDVRWDFYRGYPKSEAFKRIFGRRKRA